MYAKCIYTFAFTTIVERNTVSSINQIFRFFFSKQVLLCNKLFGWQGSSRFLICISTKSTLLKIVITSTRTVNKIC